MKQEYLNLYDRKGNLLEGYAIRGQKSKDLRGVVIVFIENSKGELLIQKTSPSRGSIYATTGGHVDYGSNFDDTIIREIKEELGLTISKEEIKELTHYILEEEKYFLKAYYLKKDIDINDIIIQKDEVEFVKWLSKEEIDKLIDENKFRNGNIPGYKYLRGGK